MFRKIIFITVASVSVLSCATRDREADLRAEAEQIRLSLSAQNRLHVSQYTLRRHVSFSDSLSSLLGFTFHAIGDRKFYVPVEADFRVYLSMDSLAPSSVSLTPTDTIIIHAPALRTELASTRILWQESRESVSLFRSSFSEEELHRLISQSLPSLIDAAPSPRPQDYRLASSLLSSLVSTISPLPTRIIFDEK